MTTETLKPSRAVKVFRGIGIAGLLLVSLLILVMVHENWSGAREWKRVEARLIDAGVELDPKKLIGEVPPADENFGAHPLVASLNKFETGENDEVVYDDPGAVEEIRKLVIPKESQAAGLSVSWETRTRPDFSYLAEHLELPGQSAQDVLAWIKQYEATMDELDRAAMRPRAFYPFTMGETFIDQISQQMPHVRDFMNLAKFYGMRASAELQAGNEETARQALHTLMQIGELAASQPSLISHLVGISCHDIELSVIWYGLDRELWSGESLKWIRSRLRGEPEAILANLERAMNFELCVFIIGGMDYLKAVNSGEAVATINGIAGTGSNKTYVYSLIPNGIWDHNKAFAAEWIFESGLEPLSRGEMGDEKKEGELESELRLGNFPAPRRFMAAIMVPATSGISKRSFATAVATEMADLSCALELYREKNGAYPESLVSLVSDSIEKIPVDRFSESGDLIQYRRDGDRYLLYSVGQNRTDEGGDVVFRNAPSQRIDRDRGDLVWGYTDFEDLPEGE